MYLKPVPFSVLEGKTVVKTACGHPLMPKLGSYGATVLTCSDDTTYVVWQAYGEVNLSQEVCA